MSVSDAAAAAEKMLQDAQKNAEKKVADSRRKSSEMVSKAHEQALASSKSTVEAARDAAMKEAEQVKCSQDMCMQSRLCGESAGCLLRVYDVLPLRSEAPMHDDQLNQRMVGAIEITQ